MASYLASGADGWSWRASTPDVTATLDASSRSVAGQRRDITALVGMDPASSACRNFVTDDQFLIAALFLGNCKIAHHGESRPAEAEWATPEFLRRMRFPVGLEQQAGNYAGAIVAEICRKIGAGLRSSHLTPGGKTSSASQRGTFSGGRSF